jgi:hypothetical protein
MLYQNLQPRGQVKTSLDEMSESRHSNFLADSALNTPVSHYSSKMQDTQDEGDLVHIVSKHLGKIHQFWTYL